ncbi:LuxR C-terminal-related transcriptional regulator [Streptomyces sp. bgisy034]|uniref:response regulator transcription factor n=1 Tax=Streptomyces sp. bgisy034 TaxID=3413774 RepID=UPI003EB86D29
MSVIEVTDLRKSYGGRAVLDGVSFSVEEGEIFGVLGPNGAGKTTTVECVEGLRVPDAGRTVLSPAVASRLVPVVRTPRARGNEPLSAREREVLALVVKGTPNREIARELFISEATVKTHLTHLYARLGVNDRAAAVATAYERGILGQDGYGSRVFAVRSQDALSSASNAGSSGACPIGLLALVVGQVWLSAATTSPGTSRRDLGTGLRVASASHGQCGLVKSRLSSQGPSCLRPTNSRTGRTRRAGRAAKPSQRPSTSPQATRSNSTARAGTVIADPARCSTPGASPCSSREVSTTTS